VCLLSTGILSTEVEIALRWKHAATCHQGSTINGERDIYTEDDVYNRLIQLS